MTLEDFFTLTEIKNGLTVLSRVKELVTVMQKENDCAVKNVGDATRQWASVASTISATENDDCLDHFIQLDGLRFINGWLKDAQKYSNDTNDSCVEESLTVLLRALEKLHISSEKSISSGIWTTVKNLLGHNSSRVQDRARVLFESWKQGPYGENLHHNEENARRSDKNENAELSGENGNPFVSDVHASREIAATENVVSEGARGEVLPSRGSDSLRPETVEELKIQTQGNELENLMSDRSNAKDGSPDPLASSVALNTVQENEETPICSAERNTTTGISSSVPKDADSDEQLGSPKYEKQSNEVGGMTEKSDVSASSCLQDSGAVFSGGNVVTAEESAKEPFHQNDANAEAAGVSQNNSVPGSERIPASSKNGMDDKRAILSDSEVFKIAHQDDECFLNAFRDSSDSGSILRKCKEFAMNFSRTEDLRAVDEDECSSDGSGDLISHSEYSKPTLNSRIPSTIKDRSDMELDYGMVDALEVARQVAQEVEREMGEHREPFCTSSSEKITGRGIRQPGSPDSITGNQDQQTDVQLKEVQAAESHSGKTYSDEEVRLSNQENLNSENENLNDIESSQLTDAAQEAEANTDKGLCNFDLNQEVCSEDVDHVTNPVSTPIPVVSVSRPAAVPGLPLSPLQFEGTLGWKGSAATSAFRPASPRRNPDIDRTSTGGYSDSSKLKQDFLTFDLNVAETGDEFGKQIPVSPGLPPGESLVEASPRRSEGIKLDLNCIGEVGDAPVSDFRMERRLFDNDNGYSVSPASSSSSVQPLVRNFDLNDRPCIQNDSSEPGPRKSSQNVSMYGGPKPDASVISIMGTRVEVSRKDYVPRSSLPNGRIIDPAMGQSMARTGVVSGMNSAMSYNPAPFFGYNGLPAGPTMYGPGGTIPYMVDARGVSIVPQMMGGPTSVIPHSSYSQPPFIMSMTDAPMSPNSGGHVRPNLDLNSGFMIEGTSRDSGGLRQLFFPIHSRGMEEQLRTNLQPSSSGISGKRKEPDGGWEAYPFSYKHQQPPWK